MKCQKEILMGIINWIKNLFKPKEIKPAYRSEADNAAVEYYNEKTIYANQQASNNESDAMEP